MKNIKTVILILVMLFIFSVTAYAEKPEIESRAAILIDAKTGQILYSKNQDEKLYPASITKVMTIYLGVKDKEKLDRKFSASAEAIDAVPRDTSNIALDYGEEITLKDALYAAMLMSANDSCNLIAEAVSGDMNSFVNLMNSTAKSFGARNTNFANANGLTDEKHYTTAYDFAMITKEALKNQDFKDVFCSMEYSIAPTNKNKGQRNFHAQHRMVHQQKYEELGVKGGKTGFTSASGYTLVTYGVKGDKELVCVVLKSPSFNSVYDDTEKLLKYGYEDFYYESVKAEEIQPYKEERTTYTPVGEIRFLLNKDMKKENLVKNFQGGVFQVCLPDGTVLGQLYTEAYTEKNPWETVWKVVKIVFFGIIGIIIILYAMLIISSKKRKKRRKKNRYIE